MSKEKHRQLYEINRQRNEELFNNIEKQYQELAKVNAIDEMSKDIPQKIVAYNGDPNGQHLYYEQRFEIAEALYNAGYRKQNEVKKSKGCEYCKGRAYTKKPLTVITKYVRKIELVFEFCPNCGAKMKGGE